MTDTKSNYDSNDIYSRNTGVKDSLINKLKRVITSSLIFIAAYFIAFSIHHYFTVVLLHAFDYEPHVTFNDYHNLPFHYSYWSKERITVIYSGGPLMCLFSGFVFFVMRNVFSGTTRLFMFWLSICCINLFLGLIIFCPFGIGRYDSEVYKYFAIVASWWRIGGLFFIPLAFLSVFISMITGYFLRNEFLKFSFSSRLTNSIKGKNIIIRQFYLLPIIIATPVIISVTTYESIITHFFLMLNLVVISIGFFLKNEYDLITKVRAQKEDVLNKIPVFEFMLTAGIYSVILFYLR